jgi:uncharacterized protein YyaL (SSP411 family)
MREVKNRVQATEYLRLILMAWAFLIALSATAHAAPLKNALHNHPSPYLALHESDPVAWQEWNADTLARARRENKPLFVSVGYFSCHWCHVMQHESYRDPAIAALINRHFIPVKVDRELNGALDAALIEFANRYIGVAGWPLNVVVTPDGYPAHAVLYQPPREFSATLKRLADTWRDRREAFSQAAREAAPPPAPPAVTKSVTAAELEAAFLTVVWREADTLQGGFNRVSKFPMPVHLDALLTIYKRNRDPHLGEFIRLTLDRMASQGLADHVNGGFFRYTVDPDWSTPHFEKMLYDNAQLSLLYRRAADLFGRLDYAEVAHRSLDFMLTALRTRDGGYATALSALDRQGREGGVYLWTESQLRKRLNRDEYELVRRVWALDAPAPFESGYLPMEKQSPTGAERIRLRAIQKKLAAAGRLASAPRDEKINAGLNGLALSAFSLAGRGVPRFQTAAHELRAYVEIRLTTNGQPLKTRVGERVFTDAELDDYAYLAAGLNDYARVFQDKTANDLALNLVRQAWQRFHTPVGWKREAAPLLATLRPEPAIRDGALPSASSLLLHLTERYVAAGRMAQLAGLLKMEKRVAEITMREQPFDFPGLLWLSGNGQKAPH